MTLRFQPVFVLISWSPLPPSIRRTLTAHLLKSVETENEVLQSEIKKHTTKHYKCYYCRIRANCNLLHTPNPEIVTDEVIFEVLATVTIETFY
jgi:hypothetical protein